ncbi:MAG: hypothetical protein AAF846_26235 [Chloroflexota bacterium]
MSIQNLPNNTESQLNALIKQWTARWRLRRIVLYMPRIAMVTTLVGIATSLLLGYSRSVSVVAMLIITAGAMSATFVGITTALGLWRKRGYEAIRQFENIFDLQERISTAFELLEGRIQTSPAVAQRQLDDAYKVAQTVDPRKQIPLKIKWLEWAVALFIIIFLVVSVALSAYLLSQGGNAVSTQTQTAINSASETTRDITEGIATDNALTDEERSSLLESAEIALEELENPDTTAEDSFVTMSDLESDLREQVEALREEVAESNDNLQQANETLNNQNTPSQQGDQSDSNAESEQSGNPQEGGDNAGDALADSLEQESQSVQDMSEQERQDLAQQLLEVADEVRETNPELADALDEAAEALENNNIQEFESAMNDAAQQSRSSGERNNSRQESSNTLEQAADQAQQAANEIAQSEAQANPDGDQQGQQGEQSQQGQQEGQPQQESGQQQGQSQQGGQQDGQGENPASQNAGKDGAQGQSEGGQQQGQQPGDAEAQQGPASSQSQDGDGAGEAGNGDGQDQQGITAVGEQELGNNTNNDGGETTFDSIFAPNQINTQQGDTNIVLETDASTDQTREGEFQENPTGESTVPYNQVFSSYADSASSALENGYVPLGVRDVVRDYFTSLEPTGRDSGDE